MARSRNSGVDNPTLLEAALEGLELQKKRIEDQIAEVRRMLHQRPGRGSAASSASDPTAKPAQAKRPLSPAARKRIAAAQKKRWAAFRATQRKAEK